MYPNETFNAPIKILRLLLELHLILLIAYEKIIKY
jgi:hypothetical protein